jgi:hypothetical protein
MLTGYSVISQYLLSYQEKLRLNLHSKFALGPGRGSPGIPCFRITGSKREMAVFINLSEKNQILF